MKWKFLVAAALVAGLQARAQSIEEPDAELDYDSLMSDSAAGTPPSGPAGDIPPPEFAPEEAPENRVAPLDEPLDPLPPAETPPPVSLPPAGEATPPLAVEPEAPGPIEPTSEPPPLEIAEPVLPPAVESDPMDQELAPTEIVTEEETILSEPVPASPARQAEETPAPDPVAVDFGVEDTLSADGRFRKPPGPPQGGTLVVPHPSAPKGLIRINKDGTYQYRTEVRPKSQAVSFRLGIFTPPVIEGQGPVTYESMYGTDNLFGLLGDYEWQPFQGFGALGVQLGGGFATARGNGRLASSDMPAIEAYDLYIVPLSAFAVYRFEYVRRQWIVPFVNGGVTYFGLAEKRDDDTPPKFAGAAAVGGGGGVHLSISRLDPASAFVMDREYGIADLWLTIEARVMQGLDETTDFTSQIVTAGITMDF